MPGHGALNPQLLPTRKQPLVIFDVGHGGAPLCAPHCMPHQCY